MPVPLSLRLVRRLLPFAERDEVVADLNAEFHSRARASGALAARLWLWGQVLRSTIPLARRMWWRGTTGFESDANRMRPGGNVLESWLWDLRFAARRIRTRPLYALLAVVTLALGIGGTAAIFGIGRPLLVDPLPYKDENHLAVFWNTFDWNESEILYIRGRVPGFSTVAGWRGEDAPLLLGDAARLIAGVSSSFELFDVLGVRPFLGRGFQRGDDDLNAPLVAVLSYGLWQELGGDPSIIGQRISLGGMRTVVGVMPPGFWFPSPDARVWLNEQLDPGNGAGNYALIGRYAPGYDQANMRGPLARFAALLKERFTYPKQWDKTANPKLTAVREYLVGSLRPSLYATFVAMALILAIACANVAALVLGQVEGRATELAVRSALGADRKRLVQQIVSESLLIGIIAGLVGTGLAAVGFRLLVESLPLGALAERAQLDWSVFAVGMLIAVLASMVVAIVPTIALWRGNLRDLISKSRSAGIAGRGGRLEGSLVVTQVALAVLIAAGAGLLVRSVTKLYAIDPGVDRRGVAVVDVVQPAGMNTEQRRQTLRSILAEIEALPGVQSAAAAFRLPLRGNGWSSGLGIEGQDLGNVTTYVRFSSPRYLETVGMRVIAGRGFEDADRTRAEPMIVINEALKKKYFPASDPVGKHVANGWGTMGTVIGVVNDVAEGNLTDEMTPVRYMLYEQLPFMITGQSIAIRTTRPEDAEAILEPAKRAIQRVSTGIAVQEATTMERLFDRAVGPARQVMTLLTLLTGLAMTLGAVGVYGVISHFVSRRKRDWGIRVALGMAPSRVFGMIVGRGVTLVAIGAVLGMLFMVLAKRLLASFLYGVTAGDPAAMLAAVAVLLGVGALAAFVPAYRASRIDPAIVLREQ